MKAQIMNAISVKIKNVPKSFTPPRLVRANSAFEKK